MSAGTFQISYPALLQVERLEPRERAALSALFKESGDKDTRKTRRTPSGEFISRLGAHWRVLWRDTQSGPEILSVVDDSYAG